MGEIVSTRARFPSATDLEFYRHQQPLPLWARSLGKPVVAAIGPTIDDVVNAHGGIRFFTNGETAALNLLSIVQSYRRRQKDLARELNRIAEEPGCLIDPKKRAAFARKWAARLDTVPGKMPWDRGVTQADPAGRRLARRLQIGES